MKHAHLLALTLLGLTCSFPALSKENTTKILKMSSIPKIYQGRWVQQTTYSETENRVTYIFRRNYIQDSEYCDSKEFYELANNPRKMILVKFKCSSEGDVWYERQLFKMESGKMIRLLVDDQGRIDQTNKVIFRLIGN